MTPRLLLLALPFTFTLTSGCFFKRAEASLPETAIEPCAEPLREIREATYADAARDRVRDYLRCLVSADAVPDQVPVRVEHALERNPYDATHRQDVAGHFFDLEQLEELPAAPRALPVAVELLRDQALARSAMGEHDVAEAARARAARLERLDEVLRDVLD